MSLIARSQTGAEAPLSTAKDKALVYNYELYEILSEALERPSPYLERLRLMRLRRATLSPGKQPLPHLLIVSHLRAVDN